MITLGCRVHDLGNGDFEEVLERGEKLGIKALQLVLWKSFPEKLVTNQALTPDFAEYIRRVVLKRNMHVAVLGCYLNLATPDEMEYKMTLARYKACIQFAAWMGATVVGTETGALNKEYRSCSKNQSEEAYILFRDRLKNLLEFAERVGVTIAIEPVATHIIYSPERAKRLLEELESPNLKIIFDPANLISVENENRQESILENALTLIGKDIVVMHVKDYIICDGERIEVDAGEGRLPYRKIRSWLHENKPYMDVILEGTTPENMEKVQKVIQ